MNTKPLRIPSAKLFAAPVVYLIVACILAWAGAAQAQVINFAVPGGEEPGERADASELYRPSAMRI